MNRFFLPSLALACALASPALAAEAVATPAAPAVVIPWGDWVSAILGVVVQAMLPVLIAFLIGAVAKVAPWAAELLKNTRVEQAITNGAAYGINAVGGAVKGEALTIKVGSAAIAAGTQRILNVAPAKVIAAAGGPAGIAEKIFRTLHLEPDATTANTLAPALQVIPLAGAK